MDANERYDLITRNLQEVVQEDELRELVNSGKEISLYWGTTPTGSISIAYFFPMLKVADFLNAGIKVKILLADLHAALDKTPWDLLEKRTAYYKRALHILLKQIGVDDTKLEFVLGSSMQKDGKYFEDLLRMSMETTIRNATKAASEVVKMSDNPFLGNLLYPLMQALDEEYLKVDIQFGGIDQRKILVLARENLPKIGYKARIEVMSPMIRGLVGEKMSSSVENTKIDLLDDEATVIKKIKAAECAEGNPDNGIMSLLQYFIMILKSDMNETFTVERPDKFGGNVTYSNYNDIEKDFADKKLHPLDIKNAVAKEINLLLNAFREDNEVQELHRQAYPDKYIQ